MLVPTHGFCVPQPRAIGTVVLNRGKAPTIHSPLPRQASRFYSDFIVMSDKNENNTEICSVCKTSYPRCMTCEKYGRKGKHSLDRDKAMNSHDNPSYINDKGDSQPSWNRKESK